MTDSNNQTIQAYETHVQEYIDGTAHDISDICQQWMRRALAGIPKDGRVVEFGSAFGRDAVYLQNLGYAVECTDATQAFIDLLKEQGFAARQLNVITDDLGGPYDFIFANAVLLHFTRGETKQVLAKVYNALKPGGTFAFSVKQGNGEEWTDNKLGVPRYFCYWTSDQLHDLVQAAGFTGIEITLDEAPAATWLLVIAKRP